MTSLYSFFTAVLRGGCRRGSLLCAVVLFTFVIAGALPAQQNAGLGTASPHPSALLDMTSGTQGLLVPRMNTLQRTSIASPANGLLVFDTDASRFYFYNSATTSWIPVLAGSELDAAVLLAPAASARNLVQPTLPGVVPLTLRGAAGQTVTLFAVENSTGATLFSVGNTGEVVLSGALSPSGSAGVAGYILQSQGAGQPPVWVSPSGLSGATGASWSLTGNAAINAATQFLGTVDAQPLFIRTGNVTRATVLAGGNIGIGTTTPQTPLEIAGAGSGLRFTNLTASSSTNATSSGKVLSVNAGGDVVLVDDLLGSGGGGGTPLPTGPAGVTLRYDGANWVTSSTLVNTGTQVGIGTTPTRTLDVNGTVRLGTSGTTIANVIKVTATVTPTYLIGPQSSTNLTFTVPGAAPGATVSVSPASAMTNGLFIAYSRVSAANTVEVRISNMLTGLAISLAGMDYYITVIE